MQQREQQQQQPGKIILNIPGDSADNNQNQDTTHSDRAGAPTDLNSEKPVRLARANSDNSLTSLTGRQVVLEEKEDDQKFESNSVGKD